MYKRVLGGYLLHIQQEVFRLLRTIDEEGVLDEAIHFLDQQFHVHIQEDDIALRRQRLLSDSIVPFVFVEWCQIVVILEEVLFG